MSIPDEVAVFLREVEPLRMPELGVLPLSPEQAAQRSEELTKASAFAALLGLIVLDDANDSSPYCYISRGVGSGMILQHDHEGAPVIRFADLAAFGEGLQSAVAQGEDLAELRCLPLSPHPDQAALSAELRARFREEDPLAEPFVRVFLPLLDPADVQTLALAATAQDFLIREAAAELMARHPLPAHQALAAQLAVDAYPQVQTPARRVLMALKAPLPPPAKRKRSEDDGQRPRQALGVSMIDLPDGKVRLLFDDLQRQGKAAPFSWNTKGFVTQLEVDLGALQRGQLDTQSLADVGINLLGLLGRQRK